MSSRISHSQLARLFRRLTTGYRAGIDLNRLYARETETCSGSHRQQAMLVSTHLQQGQSLAKAMKSTGAYFPELAVSIVDAGETGGRLDQAFERLAEHYENLVRFRNQLLLSVAWPLFELAFAICIIGALILILGFLVNEQAANWFGVGSPLANFLVYALCVASVLSVIVLVGCGMRYGWFGTLPMRIARRIPLLGNTIEALSLSRFAWTMSIAENAGIDAVQMAKMSLAATQNHFYQRLESTVCNDIQRGRDFASTLGATGAFPTEFLTYVENGEVAGELAETMDRASRDLQTQAENNLKILGTIGFVLTLLFVAAVIGTIVITMAQKLYLDPINDLINL